MNGINEFFEQVKTADDPKGKFSHGFTETTPKAKRGEGKLLSQILSEPDAEEKYLVNPLLSKGDKGYVVSTYKMGKTLFLTQLALCLSMSVPFLGMEIPEPSKVLYIRFELKDLRFKKRLQAMINGLGGLENIKIEPVFELTRGFNILLEKDFQWVVDLIRKHKAGVLIFDPFYKMVSLDLKDTANAMPLIRRFDSLIEMFPGLLIIIAHHLRKQSTDDRDSWDMTYGPMFFFADMDFEIRLKAKHTRDAVFTFDHISNDVPIDSFNFKRNPETLLYYVVNPETDHLEEILDYVRSCKPNKTNLKEWMMNNYGFSRRDAKIILERLLSDGKIIYEGSKTQGCLMVKYEKD